MTRKLLLLALLLIPAHAQALKLTLWNRDLTSKVGAAESSGNKFNLQVVKEYSGPVIALFSQSEDERKAGLFPGLQNRYDGFLKAGQLSLLLPDDRSEAADNVPGNAAAAPAIGLGKLLQPYKLNVAVQFTGLLPENNSFSVLGVRVGGSSK